MNGRNIIKAINELKEYCNNSNCDECIFMDISQGCVFHNKPYEFYLTDKMINYLEED